MKQFNGKKILFFAPKYFGYELEIVNKLKELGAEVYYFDERPSNSFLMKASIRLKLSFTKSYIKKYYYQIINDLKDTEFDYIFFFKGETISVELLNKCKATFQKAKIILYLCDSIANYPHIKNCISLFDRALSFDQFDSNQIKNLIFRPLFFIDCYQKIENQPDINDQYKYDLLFIGTIHSDRWTFLKKIKEQAAQYNYKVYYFLYFQSPILFYLKKLFIKKYRSVPFLEAKFKPLNKTEVINLIESSRVILDIQHPRQTGLTIRTIEILGANRKLITTNQLISNYDFYNDHNILIIDRNEPVLNLDFISQTFIKPSNEIYNNYKLDSWLDDVFNI